MTRTTIGSGVGDMVGKARGGGVSLGHRSTGGADRCGGRPRRLTPSWKRSAISAIRPTHWKGKRTQRRVREVAHGITYINIENLHPLINPVENDKNKLASVRPCVRRTLESASCPDFDGLRPPPPATSPKPLLWPLNPPSTRHRLKQ